MTCPSVPNGTRHVAHDECDVLHEVAPGHFSVYVGDSFQHSEENLTLHLSMPSLLLS